LVLIALSLAGQAQAGTLTAAQILSQFNVVTFGNFSDSADVNGRVVVGGNMTQSGGFGAMLNNAAASSFGSISVYGAASGNSFTTGAGGGADISGNNAAGVTVNGPGGIYVGGTNRASLQVTNSSGALTVGGVNSGSVIAAGGSVYVGGVASGGVTGTGAGNISINGNNAGTISSNGSGNVYITGNNTGSINLASGTDYYKSTKGTVNGAAVLQTGLSLTKPADPLASAPLVSTFETPLTNLATQLSNLTANSTTSVTNGGSVLNFNAAPVNGRAVFDVTAATLAQSGLSQVQMNLNGATSVFINVNVGGCSTNCSETLPTNLNFSSPTSYAEQVVWNFVNITTLTTGAEFGGTILAPQATVTANSPIDGTVVAANFSSSNQVHAYNFTGTLPTAAPEPTSLVVFGSGIAGLGFLRWRRRRVE
jgi:choice-of-anchor A domain-containing protein